MYQEEDYLLLSGLQHFAFCRRQWALIHVETQWKENVRTVEGGILHERVHSATREKRGDVIITRSMPVMSGILGITGTCDAVELHRDEGGVTIHGEAGRYRVVPIEYKKGRPKEHNADALQLCAQAMCLEEMFVCEIGEAYLFYGDTKRRCSVPLTPALRDTVRSMLEEMHGHYRRGYTPKAKRTKACKACSLMDICLPALFGNASVEDYIKSQIGGVNI